MIPGQIQHLSGDPSTPRCPLCNGSSVAAIESVTWRTIVEALTRYVGTPPPATLGLVDRRGTVERIACASCGLEFVEPSVEGSAAFYEYLTDGTDYYDRSRWDFERARTLIGPGDSVIDLGCGPGTFLSSLGGDRRCVGVDSNPRAVRRASERGIEAIESTPHDIIERLAAEPPFDVVCSFQTLEHLDNVEQLLDVALRLVSPGGLIILSVPNRVRLPVNETAVLDWPPHHLSRWAPEQMRKLGTRCGLDLVDVHVERRGTIQAALLLMYVMLRTAIGQTPIDALKGSQRPRVTWRGSRTKHTMMGVFRAPARRDPEAIALHQTASTRDLSTSD